MPICAAGLLHMRREVHRWRQRRWRNRARAPRAGVLVAAVAVLAAGFFLRFGYRALEQG